jgi:hypothetical protein
MVAVMAAIMGRTFWVLYAQPQAFAVDHLFGHFRGPIYDEGSGSLIHVLALRFLSLAWVMVLLGYASAAEARKKRGRIQREETALAVLALGVALAVRFYTLPLIEPGREGILAELATVERTPHAVLHVDGGHLNVKLRKRMGLEVERNVSELQQLLGLPDVTPVEVFIYASSQQKGRLMGAANTLVARPWAREIHVQASDLPIPALRHELAHVLLGDLTGGPFHVAAVFGVLPHIMIVEGAATALEDGRGELTLSQQAAVMKRMGRLPSLRRLMAPLGFFTESGARAYTAAGSFFQHVMEKHGGDALVRVYQAGSLDLLGGSLQEQEQAWHEWLDAVHVPQEAMARAQRVFLRGGLGERQCADDAADLRQRARELADEGRLDEAEAAYRTVARLDGQLLPPLLAFLDVAARADDAALLSRLSDEILAAPADRPAQAQVHSTQAEWAVRSGAPDRAILGLEKAREFAEGAAQRRALEILIFAARTAWRFGTDTPCGAAAWGILKFLVGHGPERAHGRIDLLALDGAVRGVPDDTHACGGDAASLRAVVFYLMGRQLVADDPARAEDALLQVERLGGFSPLVTRETVRLKGEALEHAGRHAEAAELYGQLAKMGLWAGEAEEALTLMRRARFAAEHGGKW